MQIKKEHRQFLQNVKAILWKFKHALVVAAMDKKKMESLPKDEKIIKQFKKVIKLVNVGAQNLWG